MSSKRERPVSFLLRNRRLTEWLQTLRWRLRFSRDRPILVVHQMARVGSITVLRALRRNVPGVHILHTHYLNQGTIQRYRQQFNRQFATTRRAGLHREYLSARLLHDRIRTGVRERWKVISLVRDPVARTASAFFMHLPYTMPELGAQFRNEAANVPRLIDLFLRESEPEHQFTLDWFDLEVRDVLGIDVFAQHFPREAGFATYAGPFADLIVLRLEDLDRVGPTALGRFLGVPPIPLAAANRGEDQDWADAYRRFLATIEMPREYLDRMYGSRLARHFYGTEELEAFRARWA